MPDASVTTRAERPISLLPLPLSLLSFPLPLSPLPLPLLRLLLPPLLLASSLLPSVARADEIQATSHVPPLLAKYCLECHGTQKHESGLSLASIPTDARATAAQKTWKSVWQRLDAGEMPPPYAPQPSDAERKELTDFIESTLGQIGGRGARDPGTVVARRLNKTEYKNTVRDLVGVEAPTDLFPSDDVGYGFDNIGDVLSLPPLLLEKYLVSAEKIVDRAVFSPNRNGVPIQHFSGRDLSATVGSMVSSDPPTLQTNGELYHYLDVSTLGRYVIRLRAAGDQVGSEPVKVAVRVDGVDAQKLDIPAARGNPESYEVEVTLKPGQRRIGIALLNDFYEPKAPAPNDRNLIVHYFEVDGPKTPSASELPESHRRIFIALPEEGKKTRRAAAKEVLTSFLPRAFRRPVQDRELDKYLKLFDRADQGPERGSFEAAMKVPLAAALISPYFLFRIETDRRSADPRGAHLLGDYELASRLSYFLWSSMPDAELLSAASNAGLQTPQGIEAQVKRMLADPKAKALSESFTSQWLQIRRLEGVTPDAKRFPEFDEKLREAMAREPVLLFQTLLEEDRSLVSLLDADFTFLNERLARHYGITGVTGDEMRRVTLTDARRGGILTMGSVLASTSTPARTSPVKRGKWVLESILGTPPPPPLPNVGALVESSGSAQAVSVRKRMEAHRKDPNCASCHARMDPIGFGLEHFDAVGAWRDRDDGLPIDASAALPGGKPFDGAAQLRAELLARKANFVRCLTEKMLTYALGRGLEFADHLAVREIDQAVSSQGYRLPSLVVEVAKSYPFRYRRNVADDGPTQGKKP